MAKWIGRKPESAEDYRDLLLSFIASLTLADHTGDMSNDIGDVLTILGLDIEWDEQGELGDALGKMGYTTLYGTPLASDGDDESHPDGGSRNE